MNQHSYKGMSTLDRFFTKVNKAGPIPENKPELGPCWQWTAGLIEGYGVFSVGKGRGRMARAHRWYYEEVKGPIERRLTLDHLCRNRACVNPAHLEPVTKGVNTLRGTAPSAQNARKTNCPKGHPLDGFRPSESARYCKTCNRIYKQLKKLAESIKR